MKDMINIHPSKTKKNKTAPLSQFTYLKHLQINTQTKSLMCFVQNLILIVPIHIASINKNLTTVAYEFHFHILIDEW